MRVVLQRVSHAEVRVDDQVVSAIGQGFVLLVGVEAGDTSEDAEAAVGKISGLRVFSDDGGKMNLSIGDVGGQIIVVSQFTLLGDVRKGRRPSFSAAAPAEVAEPLVEEMVDGFRRAGIETVSGVFGAHMLVDLVNDGPVTLVLSVRDAKLG